MSTFPSVTVAVSAYNEASNIAHWLSSVLSQKERGFEIKMIVVHSDGSTDETAAIVKSFQDPRIRLFDHSTRTGKSQRLNEIYEHLSTDFLIQTDADVEFAHEAVMHDLLKPMMLDSTVMMCGGNPLPLKAVTWIEQAVNYTTEVYLHLRTTFQSGHNAFSADGRLLAYRQSFVKKIKIPVDMIANDAYTYLVCLQHGFIYNHVPTAVVYYRSPQTLRDQVRQNTRFLAARKRFIRYFDPALLTEVYSVPRNLILPQLLISFLKHPVSCGCIYIINRYCTLLSEIQEQKMNAKWNMATSTKTLELRG